MLISYTRHRGVSDQGICVQGAGLKWPVLCDFPPV